MSSDSKERRRHVRRATRHGALATFGPRAAANAEILDYSDVGLLLGHFAQPIGDDEGPALRGSAISIRIPLLGRQGQQHSEIQGIIVHAQDDAVGVEISDVDDDALYSLQLSADDYGKQRGQEHARRPVARSTAAALRARCSAILEDFLRKLAPEVIESAIEALKQRGLDALESDSRTLFNDSAAVIRAQRASFTENFATRSLRRVKQFAADGDGTALVRRSSGLELMDDDDIDDLLAQSTIIASVEAHIVPQLNEFERRLSRLVNTKVTRQTNPFGLQAICQCFRECMRVLHLQQAVRSVVLQSLKTSLESSAQALYGELNRALLALRTESLSVVPVASVAPPAGGHRVMTSAPGPVTPLPAIAGVPGAPLPHNVQPFALTAQRSQTSGAHEPPSPSAAAGAQGGNEVGRLLDVVGRLDDSARALAQGAQAMGSQLAQSKLVEATIADLLQAIDRMSIEDLRGPRGDGGVAVIDQLKSRLLDPAFGDPRRLGGALEKTLATTSDLVSRSIANLIPDSPLDSLLRRLERTLLKVSITDPTFPGWAEHPARQVVNLIDQYAMAADDTGRFFDTKLQRNLNTLVDRVCDRADEDPRIFEVVRTGLVQDLDGIRQARRSRVHRLQEAMAGRDRIRLARERADEALRKRLSGRDLPRSLLQLFDLGLKHYLVLVAVQAGEQETDWHSTLQLVDRLLDWFSSSDEAREDGNLLLGLLERQLANVIVDRHELARITSQLADLVATFNAEGIADWDHVSAPLFNVGGNTQTGELPKAITGMRVGDWWDISEERNRVPMQLIWFGHGGGDFTFTNRSATRKFDLTATDLVKRIEDGSVRPSADLDLPMLDRSEFSLLDETYRGLLARATHQHNTGLINRKGFLHRLSLLTVASAAARNEPHALCVLEFDQFRLLEQSQGGDATERLASELAAVVRTYTPAESTVASLREDAIGVLLPNHAVIDVERVVASMLQKLHDYPFEFGGRTYRIGVNIGYLSFLPSECTGLDALRRADLAAMASKGRGRNTSQAYAADSPDLLTQNSLAEWAGRTDALLAGDEGLFLRCQRVEPIAKPDGTTALPYYEVLLGLRNSDSSNESPDTLAFITALEELGRAHEIDRWVVQHVFDWLADNAEVLELIGGLAVNLSAQSIARDDFAAWLRDSLAQRAAIAHKLVFEITETAALSGYGAAQEFIREIRRFGCRFALDDFGSGYTSYAHLKNLRSDILKIDGSFVRDMGTSDSDAAIVKSMNDIAHVLGMQTVAEWVEHPEILARLTEIGVDYAQGYAIERPYALSELAANLVARMAETGSAEAAVPPLPDLPAAVATG